MIRIIDQETDCPVLRHVPVIGEAVREHNLRIDKIVCPDCRNMIPVFPDRPEVQIRFKVGKQFRVIKPKRFFQIFNSRPAPDNTGNRNRSRLCFPSFCAGCGRARNAQRAQKYGYELSHIRDGRVSLHKTTLPIIFPAGRRACSQRGEKSSFSRVRLGL